MLSSERKRPRFRCGIGDRASHEEGLELRRRLRDRVPVIVIVIPQGTIIAWTSGEARSRWMDESS